MDPSRKPKTYPGQKPKSLYAEKLCGKKRRKPAPEPASFNGRTLLWAGLAVLVVVILVVRIF